MNPYNDAAAERSNRRVITARRRQVAEEETKALSGGAPLSPGRGAVVMSATGALLHRSKNLRGLLDFARKSAPVGVDLVPAEGLPGYYSLAVVFECGATAYSTWADWRVCADWITARRSWPHVRVSGAKYFVARLTCGGLA